MNVYQKLFNIQNSKEFKELLRTEENKFQKYKYVSEYEILKLLRPLLSEQKLTLTFSDDPQTAHAEKNDKEWMVKYCKRAILTSTEDPKEQLIFYCWAMGSNTDPAKAKGAADTYVIKYFLTKFFLIPATDELDPDITKSQEHANRLKGGQQETAEQIKARHRDRDLDLIIKKHGLRYQASPEYRQWQENYGEPKFGQKEVTHE